MTPRAMLQSAALLLAVAGCKGEPKLLGEPVPASAERATIQAVMSDKARYAGRTVVLEGRVGGEGCADCHGVLVTDATWRILVEPGAGFAIPVRTGAAVRVWGVVKVETPGTEHEGGEGAEHRAEEEREHGEHGKEDPAHERLHADLGNVELKAKGVEWL